MDTEDYSQDDEVMGLELFGSPDDDVIRGGQDDDTISGDAGDDRLRGRAGNDLLFGGAGFDLLNGAGGNDTLFGGPQNDFLRGGAGNDVLHGDSGLTTVRGSDLGADRLIGGDGFDVLWAGDGNDSLRSGDGFDTFGFKYSNPLTPLAAGTGAAFASIEDFSAADDTLIFDVAGLGLDAVGANFADGSGGLPGGAAESFFSGAASGANGERVVIVTDQSFASGLAAVQAVGDEQAGDFVIYFNTTVNTGSLLVVSAPDTATSIARFTNFDSLEDLQSANFTAGDFLFV